MQFLLFCLRTTNKMTFVHCHSDIRAWAAKLSRFVLGQWFKISKCLNEYFGCQSKTTTKHGVSVVFSVMLLLKKFRSALLHFSGPNSGHCLPDAILQKETSNVLPGQAMVAKMLTWKRQFRLFMESYFRFAKRPKNTTFRVLRCSDVPPENTFSPDWTPN